jgi:3'(2'), 5'-bisphosphate nucleotidase
MSLSGANPSPLRIPDFAPDQLNFLESVEAAHTSHSFNDRVAGVLNIQREPTRMDSQAKYCALARGDGGVYLRMPTGVGYIEKIWVREPRLHAERGC